MAGVAYITSKDGWLYKFVELAQNPAGSPLNDDADVRKPFDRYAVGKCKLKNLFKIQYKINS